MRCNNAFESGRAMKPRTAQRERNEAPLITLPNPSEDGPAGAVERSVCPSLRA